MVEVAKLNAELTQLIGQRDKLRAENPGTMPDAAAREDKRLVDRILAVQELIEEESQKERDARVENTRRFLNDPNHVVPRGAVNADDDGRRTLEQIGWSMKAGMVMRMTSLGREVAFCPEEVLFGPVPTESDRQEEAAYVRQVRAIMQPGYRNAFVRYIRNVARHHNAAMGFNSLTGQEQNTLSEGNDGDGGFLVPPDVQTEILVRLPQTSVMRQAGMARVVTTSRDRLEWPAIAPNADDGSVYSDGFVGSWVGETPAFADNSPSFQKFEVAIRKLRATAKVPNDLINDSGADFMTFLSEGGSQNMGLTEDKAFISGPGNSNVPLGFLNAGIQTVDIEGSTADSISNTTGNAGSAPKIQDLIYALPSQYASTARLLMRRSIEGKVRKLVDGNGRPFWLGYNDSGLAPTPRNIDGYPVLNSEWMPTDGTDGNTPIAFGAFSNYLIAQRAQISVKILLERFVDEDETGIILQERVGGGVWNTDAFRLGVV